MADDELPDLDGLPSLGLQRHASHAPNDDFPIGPAPVKLTRESSLAAGQQQRLSPIQQQANDDSDSDNDLAPSSRARQEVYKPRGRDKSSERTLNANANANANNAAMNGRNNASSDTRTRFDLGLQWPQLSQLSSSPGRRHSVSHGREEAQERKRKPAASLLNVKRRTVEYRSRSTDTSPTRTVSNPVIASNAATNHDNRQPFAFHSSMSMPQFGQQKRVRLSTGSIPQSGDFVSHAVTPLTQEKDKSHQGRIQHFRHSHRRSRSHHSPGPDDTNTNTEHDNKHAAESKVDFRGLALNNNATALSITLTPSADSRSLLLTRSTGSNTGASSRPNTGSATGRFSSPPPLLHALTLPPSYAPGSPAFQLVTASNNSRASNPSSSLLLEDFLPPNTPPHLEREGKGANTPMYHSYVSSPDASTHSQSGVQTSNPDRMHMNCVHRSVFEAALAEKDRDICGLKAELGEVTAKAKTAQQASARMKEKLIKAESDIQALTQLIGTLTKRTSLSADLKEITSKADNVASRWRDERQKESAEATSATDIALRQRECVVCFEQSRSVVFLPCAHICACLNCSLQMTACPVCRTTISRGLRVYL